MAKGHFITVEGIDGVGKSTQAALIEAVLDSAGYDVLRLREPGGVKISEQIRAILLDPANAEMGDVCELLLYEAARAVEFLKSGDRQAARRAMVRAVDLLAHADEADILAAAKDLMGAIKAPLAEVKSTQQAVLEQNQDYLSRGALKQLEDRNKRELNARERSGIMEALASVRSLLRDALVRLASESEPVVNEDVSDVVERIAARATVTGVARALDAVSSAEARIARNVTPQLAIEVMLFDIRKALQCP